MAVTSEGNKNGRLEIITVVAFASHHALRTWLLIAMNYSQDIKYLNLVLDIDFRGVFCQTLSSPGRFPMRIRPRKGTLLLVFFAALFFSVSFLCQTALAQSLAKARKGPPPPPPPPAADQELVIPYWTTETGWSSELQLRNNVVGQDLTVTPALRLPDGTETPLTPVTIKPQEVKSVDVAAAISAAGAPQLVATYGSAVLRYHSPSLKALYASVMIRAMGHAIAFHVDGNAEYEPESVGSREGIWWLPRHNQRLPCPDQPR